MFLHDTIYTTFLNSLLFIEVSFYVSKVRTKLHIKIT